MCTLKPPQLRVPGTSQSLRVECLRYIQVVVYRLFLFGSSFQGDHSSHLSWTKETADKSSPPLFWISWPGRASPVCSDRVWLECLLGEVREGKAKTACLLLDSEEANRKLPLCEGRGDGRQRGLSGQPGQTPAKEKCV